MSAEPPSVSAELSTEPLSVSAELPSVFGRVVLVQSCCLLCQNIQLYFWNIRILKKWLLPTAATQIAMRCRSDTVTVDSSSTLSKSVTMTETVSNSEP